jgi:hypothetical protein
MKRLVIVVVAAAAGCSDPKVCNYANAGAAVADLQYRDPQSGQCQSFGTPCDSACGPCPLYAGAAMPDWAPCYGACESLTESQCLASASCHTAYSDDPTPNPVFLGCWELPPSGAITGACDNLDAQTCSEHTDCASLYTGPVNQPANFVPSFEKCMAVPSATCAGVNCGAGNLCAVTPAAPTTPMCEPTAIAGACTGTVTCAVAMPACPAGTTAGIANACYTGFCIPTSECAPPPCSTLTTESACVARTDCDTVYMGSNCTCDKNGCTCQTETFLRCQ